VSVEVIAEAGDWSALGDAEAAAERAFAALCAELGLAAEDYEVALMLTDDAAIAELNARFRGKVAPTNVLSWPALPLAPGPDGRPPAPPTRDAGAPPVALGDVALAAETVKREAGERNLVLVDHATHLIMHGALHCLGFDHDSDDQAAVMEGIERRALARIGVADPYG
jgi:probable rRNA maturation factor